MDDLGLPSSSNLHKLCGFMSYSLNIYVMITFYAQIKRSRKEFLINFGRSLRQRFRHIIGNTIEILNNKNSLIIVKNNTNHPVIPIQSVFKISAKNNRVYKIIF